MTNTILKNQISHNNKYNIKYNILLNTKYLTTTNTILNILFNTKHLTFETYNPLLSDRTKKLSISNHYIQIKPSLKIACAGF